MKCVATQSLEIAIGLLGAGMWILGCTAPSASTDGGSQPVDTDTQLPEVCSFEISTQGGTQTVCGLTIAVPPGAVTETTTIQVTHPQMEPGIFANLEQDSPVWALSTDAPDFSFLAYVVVHFPHVAGVSDVWVAKYFSEWDAWGVLDTCFRTQDQAGIRTASLGTFTVLTDLGDNEASGGGAATVTWNAQSDVFAFDTLGFAHYLPTPSGNRSVDLYGFRAGSIDNFRLSFTLTPSLEVDGALVSLTVEQASGDSENWFNYGGITPPSEIIITVGEPTADHLVGTFSGTLYKGTDPDWQELPVTATFEADVARHFWPSDDPCFME